MKEINFRIIELPTHQVLLTKDFDEDELIKSSEEIGLNLTDQNEKDNWICLLFNA